MRAADGAIESVEITDDELTLEVIGDVEAVGMCGSGLVDTVSELVRVGLIDTSGPVHPRRGRRSGAASRCWRRTS